MEADYSDGLLMVFAEQARMDHITESQAVDRWRASSEGVIQLCQRLGIPPCQIHTEPDDRCRLPELRPLQQAPSAEAITPQAKKT